MQWLLLDISTKDISAYLSDASGASERPLKPPAAAQACAPAGGQLAGGWCLIDAVLIFGLMLSWCKHQFLNNTELMVDWYCANRLSSPSMQHQCTRSTPQQPTINDATMSWIDQEILMWQRFTILRKTRSKIFFCTKRPEIVYSGANLLSVLKSEIKKIPDADWLSP